MLVTEFFSLDCLTLLFSDVPFIIIFMFFNICHLLHSYLQSDPFKSNKLLQSYAGLFNYVLWKRGPPQERKIKSEEFSLEQMEEDRLFQDEEDMECEKLY